jgi:lysophospholipase L1-like esterase
MVVPSLEDLKLYVALGDSVSKDLASSVMPMIRADRTWPPEPGAASLLYQNRDDQWPEFAGRDLISRTASLDYVNLASNRAIIEDVLRTQLKALPQDPAGPTLITTTAGGNDVLGLKTLSQRAGRETLDRSLDLLRELVQALRSRFMKPTIVLSTVYDPSDGAAQLGDGIVMRREWEWLQLLNAAIRQLAPDEGCVLADLHAHFLGHGLSERDPRKRWYRSRTLIELNARGSSEVRRVWLNALEGALGRGR